MEQPSLFPPASLTVTELSRYLRGLLESDDILQDIWVTGEISNLSRPASGHVYFTLKDPTAALRCVIWKINAFRLQMGLQNGQAIEAHGYISLYERDGQYQLYVDTLRQAGEGYLYQEFLRLKARLETEGLFDQERKRPIPTHPRCIGIITSPTGAALQDMLNTLRARYPLAEIILAPASVQGEDAPLEIVAALTALNQAEQVDVILVARGGGSLEDLWAFNDERVVRAIAFSRLPVVTGIGHETDFTLADFAADLRAPTPTAAAVLATPDRNDLVVELSRLVSRLETAFQVSMGSWSAILVELRSRLLRASPERQMQDDRQRLDQQILLMQRIWKQRFQIHHLHLEGLLNRLAALNPLAVLERGFSIVTQPDGTIVRSITQVKTRQEIQVQVADGHFAARVETINNQGN